MSFKQRRDYLLSRYRNFSDGESLAFFPAGRRKSSTVDVKERRAVRVVEVLRLCAIYAIVITIVIRRALRSILVHVTCSHRTARVHQLDIAGRGPRVSGSAATANNATPSCVAHKSTHTRTQRCAAAAWVIRANDNREISIGICMYSLAALFRLHLVAFRHGRNGKQ